jgi:hypothetical protein
LKSIPPFTAPSWNQGENPTQNFHVLKSYRQQMKKGDLVHLKAPQIVIFDEVLRKGRLKLRRSRTSMSDSENEM